MHRGELPCFALEESNECGRYASARVVEASLHELWERLVWVVRVRLIWENRNSADWLQICLKDIHWSVNYFHIRPGSYKHIQSTLWKLFYYEGPYIRPNKQTTLVSLYLGLFAGKTSTHRALGLVVWFPLRVREVPGSIPGAPQVFWH
jgi:hypothetical protein